MPTPYAVLEATWDSDDAAIRRKYLELVQRFPPEQYPAKFAAVRAAYEKIKTLEARANYQLFEAGSEDTIETIIEEAECQLVRPRPSLELLFQAAYPNAKPPL